MIGTGEYTTGYGVQSAKTDKACGVVALTLLDLKLRGLVGDLHLAGTCGGKFPAIREHMERSLRGNFPGSPFDLTIATYPDVGSTDPLAYRAALAALPRGSAVTIFTPDDTHFSIAMDCVAAGMHVLVTKPIVMTLTQHHELLAAAAKARVLVAVEVHKRWDPIYADARDRLRALGDFSQIHAYMSQPKLQLETFRAWAGKSSDISYYLNSHHVDFHEWVMAGGRGRPERVTALASTGVAETVLGIPCEDSITLAVEWVNFPSRTRGVATYTASWAAPKGDVHSQQRFFAMAHGGEVSVDQAHRGYSVATDAAGFASPNPLFMRYTPDAAGRFAGQLGYGYRSIEAFVRAAATCAGGAPPSSFDESLATVAGTLQGTAILEAGRRSLDAKKSVRIVYADDGVEPISLSVE
jgi:D-galacturonate reductase